MILSPALTSSANTIGTRQHSQELSLSTLVYQSSQNFYQYFHNVVKLSPGNPVESCSPLPTSTALIHGASSASSFVGSSQQPYSSQSHSCHKPTSQSVQNRSNFNSGNTGTSSSPIQHRNRSSMVGQLTSLSNEFLRIDFVTAAAEWFDYVNSETKGFPEMSHSVRKFNFLLDCDGSARKVNFYVIFIE